MAPTTTPPITVARSLIDQVKGTQTLQDLTQWQQRNNGMIRNLSQPERTTIGIAIARQRVVIKKAPTPTKRTRLAVYKPKGINTPK